MSDDEGAARPAAPADMVMHKATRECPMVQPHPREICGIVRAREMNRDRADAERRRDRQPDG